MSGEGFAFFRWATTRRCIAVETLTRHPSTRITKHVIRGLLMDWQTNRREGYGLPRGYY